MAFKIVWHCNPHVYSSHLRFNLWKRYEKKVGIRLLEKKPFLLPDVAVFQKKFDAGARELCRWYQKKGVLTVFDINVNYFEMWGKRVYNVDKESHESAIEMAKLSDIVSTTSPYLTEVVRAFNARSQTINESVDVEHWNLIKEHHELNCVALCAVAEKMDVLLLIKNELETWAAEKKGRYLLLIAEKKVELPIQIEQKWKMWDLDSAPNDMCEADLFLAPRDMTMSYNQGHSLTKIAQSMHMHIPAIGSAIRTYVDSPCLIANNPQEWSRHLSDMEDAAQREYLGKISHEHIVKNHHPASNLKQFVDHLKQNMN